MLRKLFPLFLTFIFVAILYYPALFTYFSQDDFFHFKVSQSDSTLLGFIKLFGFYPFEERGIAFYRPVSREVPFNILYALFGLNPIPFRILSFLIHFLNIYLVYTLAQKLFNKKYLSFFVSFFFGITAANVATLYYLAGGIQTLLATTFTLSSIIFFWHSINTKLTRFKIFAFLSFVLGMSSHEQTMMAPFLILGVILIVGSSKNLRKYVLDLLPYFILIIIVLFLEIFKIGFSSSEQQYQIVYNIKRAFNSLFWYSSWALGIPETLIDFVLPGFKLNPTLLRYWSNYYIFIFPSFFISVILLFIAVIYLFKINKQLLINKLFLLNLIWFPLGLLPVILLPLHKSTHYLAISLPAFWMLIGYIVFNFYDQGKNLFSKIFIILLFISLTTLSASSAILGSTNYWAATRGTLAEKLIKDVKSTYPHLPKGAIIYFKNDPTYPVLTKEWGNSSKQASTILNGSDALQLLYQDNTLQVYYEDLKIPVSKNNVYELVAKIY